MPRRAGSRQKSLLHDVGDCFRVGTDQPGDVPPEGFGIRVVQLKPRATAAFL